MDQKKIRQVVENLGILSGDQIERATNEQMQNPRAISRVLTDMGLVSGDQFRSFLLSQLGLAPVVVEIDGDAAELAAKVKFDFAQEHRLVPFRDAENVLHLASDDPLNLLAVENIQALLDVPTVDISIVSPQNLEALLRSIYSVEKEDLSAMLATMDKGYTGEESDGVPAGSTIQSLVTEAEAGDEAPVARLSQAIIADAVRRRTSDIHLEPLEKRFRIRYRVDGVMQEMVSPPRKMQGPLTARYKLMAGMDLAEKRVPQDGRIMVNIAGRPVDLRVSALPGIYGESIVMRILDKTTMLLSMDQLGFLSADQETWQELLRYSGGIILVTGPTGSGKTTTLYTSLSALNTIDRKIMTVEEPVEYQLDGINQTPVRPEIGLTFAAILRSFLRQSPDVVLVGEIRDFETADIALRAALTGHLVFSTLHTNDATSAPTRLTDLGVEPFLTASSLQGVLAQRLVRTLCKQCKKPREPEEEDIKRLRIKEGDKVTLCQPVGCEACNKTGFRGRVGVYELFIMTDAIRELVLARGAASEIRALARGQGMHTMGEDGLMKTRMGLTTFEEVVSVTTLD